MQSAPTTEFKNYCVLPFVSIGDIFEFGNFKIWRDTAENWKSFLGMKRPAALMNIYRDRQGKIIENKSVISFESEDEAIEIPRLISSLFFTQSLSRMFGAYPDDFYYEIFRVRSDSLHTSSHSRFDKFTRNLVISRGFKIYQPDTAATFLFQLNGLTEKEIFEKLKEIFGQPNYDYITHSMTFYYRTQFKHSAFPEIEDIQNFATAFEVFFKIGEEKNKGELIAQSLHDYFAGANDTLRMKLKTWAIEFYKTRSIYTHGGKINSLQLIYSNQRHIDIAKKIYIACISKTFEPPETSNGNDDQSLYALFHSQEAFDELIKDFTPFASGSDTGEKNLNHLVKVFTEGELDSLDRKIIRFDLYANKKVIKPNSRRRLLLAMHNILAVLEYMHEEYLKDKYLKKRYYTEALEELKNIHFFPKDNEELRHNENYLKTLALRCSEPVTKFDIESMMKARLEVEFRNKIGLSTLINCFNEFYYIYRFPGM